MLLSSWLRGLWRIRTCGAQRSARAPRLRVTRLEARRVLNASPLVPLDDPTAQPSSEDPSGTVSIDDLGGVTVDAAHFADDGSDDLFRVYRTGDQIAVSLNGDDVFSARADEVTSLTIKGSTDSDRLTIDLGPGGLPVGGVHFDAGDGAADTLLLRGTAAEVVHSPLGGGDGGVLVADSSVDYDGVELLRDSVDAAARSINLGASDAARLSGTGDGFLLETEGGRMEFGASDRLTVDLSGGDGTRLDVDQLGDDLDVDLIFSGDTGDHITFAGRTDVGEGDLSASAGRIDVSGSLLADGGRIDLHASSQIDIAAGSLIDSTGGSVELNAGPTGSLVVAGTIDVSDDATDGRGGEARLLGRSVELTDAARVDADGTLGGGTVLVGGDYQGANAAVLNAYRTSIGPGVTLSADALETGDGGRIIVWADGATLFAGAVLARGGTNGGNGGFAEVSGKGTLDFRGAADLSAPQGTTGTLLLDPATITVQAAGPDINGDGTTGDDLTAGNQLDDSLTDFPGAASVITAGALNTLLGTTDVVLSATDGITINAAVQGVNDLTLIVTGSGGLVTINADIVLGNAAGGGDLTITSESIIVDADVRTHNGGDAGDVTLTGAVTLMQGVGFDVDSAGVDGAVVINGALTFDLDGDVDGANGADDAVTLRRTGNNVELVVGVTPVQSIALAGLTSITVLGEDGADDTLTIEIPDETFGITVTFIGGTGGNDTLVLNRSGVEATATVEHVFTPPSAGSFNGGVNVAIAGGGSIQAINYEGLEPIDDNLDAMDRVFRFTGGAETITLDVLGASNRIASNLGEVVTFANPTNSLTIHAEDPLALDNLADTVIVNGVLAAFAADIVINTHGGADVVTINALSTLADVAVNGGAGADDVNLVNVSTTGTITVGGTGGSTDVETIDVTGLVDVSGGPTAVSLRAAAALTMSGAGEIRSTDGLIRLEAGTDLTVTVVRTNSGTVELTAGDDVLLGLVNADNDAAGAKGNVLIIADADSNGLGAIVDTLAGEGANITAGTAAMRAGSGIGNFDPAVPADETNDIDLAVDLVAARVTTSGDIYLQDPGGLTIAPFGLLGVIAVDGVRIDSGTGDVLVREGTGLLTVNAPVFHGGSGRITLASEGAAAGNDLVVNDDVTSTSGAILLAAFGTIQFGAASLVDSNGGQVQLRAGRQFTYSGNPATFALGDATADITGTSGYEVESNGGEIIAAAPGDVEISLLDGGAGIVRVVADSDANNTGAIRDILVAETVNVISALAELSAAEGIGGVDDLDVDVVTLRATNTTSGDIVISEASSVALDRIVNATRAVVLTAGGAITDGLAGEGVGNENVVAATLTVSAGSGIGSGTGALGEAADIDVALTGTLTATNTTVGAAQFFAVGNLAVASVTNIGRAVALETTGALSDSDPASDAAVNVTGGTVSLGAVNGIGTAGLADFDVDATVLTAINTTANEIVIEELNSVALGLVQNGNRAVTLTAGGAINDGRAGEGALNENIVAGTLVITAANGIGSGGGVLGEDADIDVALTGTLTATNTTVGAAQFFAVGDLAVAIVTNTGRPVVLESTGAITDADVVSDAAVNVIASILSLRAVSGIGAAGLADFDTNVDTLTAINTTANAIVIEEIDDLALGLVQNVGRPITLTVGGAITDGRAGEGAGFENIIGGAVVLSATTGIGSADDIDTNVDTLTATTVTGDVSIDEFGDIIIVAPGVSAGGNITLTVGRDIVVNAAVTAGVSPLEIGKVLIDAGRNAAINAVLSSDGDITVCGETGTVTLAASLVPALTGVVRLHAGIDIVQTAGSIVAASLGARAGGDITLDAATNDTDIFAASAGGTLLFRDADGYTVGSVTADPCFVATTGVTGDDVTLCADTGDLTLLDSVAGAIVRLSAAAGSVIQTGGGIDATTLGVRAGVVITLDGLLNTVDELAAEAVGTILFRNSTSFTVVSTVGPVPCFAGASGVRSTTDDVTLCADGLASSVTLAGDVAATAAAPTGIVRLIAGMNIIDTTGSITARLLGARAGGDIALDSATNDVDEFAAAGGSVLFRDADGFTVAAVAAAPCFVATTGVTASTDVTLCADTGNLVLNADVTSNSLSTAHAVRLSAGGNVTQTAGAVTGPAIGARAGGNITLLSALNDAGVFAAETTGGNISFLDQNGFTVGAVAAADCFAGANGVQTTGGNVLLVARPPAADPATIAPIVIDAPIDAGAGVVRIAAQGVVSQATDGPGAISAAALGVRAIDDLSGSGTVFDIDLRNIANQIGTFAAIGADVEFAEADGFTTGVVAADGSGFFAATNGVTGTGFVSLVAGSGTITVNSAVRGAVTLLQADDMAIAATVRGDSQVQLTPRAEGRGIGLGLPVAGELGLTSAELTFVVTPLLTIGGLDVDGRRIGDDGRDAGTIAVRGLVTVPTNLVLLTAAGVTADAAAKIDVGTNTLAIRAGGDVGQPGGGSLGIHAGVLAGLVTGIGGFRVAEDDALTIGTSAASIAISRYGSDPGQVVGVQTTSGSIAVTTANGSLVVSQIVDANGAGTDAALSAGGAASDLELNANVSAGARALLSAGDDIVQTSDALFVIAPSASFFAGGDVGEAAAPIDLRVTTVAARALTGSVFLNQDAAAGSLAVGIIDAVSGITAASQVRVTTEAGDLILAANVSAGGLASLESNGGSILQPSADLRVIAGSAVFDATGTVGQTGAAIDIAVGNVAAVAASGDVFLRQPSGNLVVANVGGVSGLSATAGRVGVRAESGSLTIAAPILAGTALPVNVDGQADLFASGAVVFAGGFVRTARGQVVDGLRFINAVTNEGVDVLLNGIELDNPFNVTLIVNAGNTNGPGGRIDESLTVTVDFDGPTLDVNQLISLFGNAGDFGPFFNQYDILFLQAQSALAGPDGTILQITITAEQDDSIAISGEGVDLTTGALSFGVDQTQDIQSIPLGLLTIVDPVFELPPPFRPEPVFDPPAPPPAAPEDPAVIPDDPTLVDLTAASAGAAAPDRPRLFLVWRRPGEAEEVRIEIDLVWFARDYQRYLVGYLKEGEYQFELVEPGSPPRPLGESFYVRNGRVIDDPSLPDGASLESDVLPPVALDAITIPAPGAEIDLSQLDAKPAVDPESDEPADEPLAASESSAAAAGLAFGAAGYVRGRWRRRLQEASAADAVALRLGKTSRLSRRLREAVR